MDTLKKLVSHLEQKGILKTPAIKKAFWTVDRALFVLPKYVERTYENCALPIIEGQTISQPLTVAFMLEKLEPCKGGRILDVGSGSGWTTALLAEIVGPQGHVFAVERIPALKEMGEKNVAKIGFVNVRFKEGNGADGWPAWAPFDRILVNAAAKKVPDALKEQLKIGGKLVIPLDNVYGHIALVEKVSEEEFRDTLFPGFSFVPFIEEEVPT